MAQVEKKYLVAGTTAGLFEDVEISVKEGQPGTVNCKRCRWCGWTAIGFAETPGHECGGPPAKPASFEPAPKKTIAPRRV
jgi:hypothetical protein